MTMCGWRKKCSKKHKYKLNRSYSSDEDCVDEYPIGNLASAADGKSNNDDSIVTLDKRMCDNNMSVCVLCLSRVDLFS